MIALEIPGKMLFVPSKEPGTYRLPTPAIWNRVERVAHEVFRVHNYHEIRTRSLEETQLSRAA